MSGSIGGVDDLFLFLLLALFLLLLVYERVISVVDVIKYRYT